MVRPEFALWLENERKSLGITRSKFARRIGISAPQMTRILNCEQAPGDVSLNAIARFFNIDPTSLYQLAGKMPLNDNKNPPNKKAETLYDNIVDLPPDLLDRAVDFVNILKQLKLQNEQISNESTGTRSERPRR